jgi:hypothetical protein
MWRRDAAPVIMLISTALLLDSNIRNSVCTPAKLPCRRVVNGSHVLTLILLPGNNSTRNNSPDTLY